MSHIPVLLDEVLSVLRPANGETYIDGTFGAGGYSRAILAAADCHLIAFDRDPDVEPRARQLQAEFGTRFQFIHAPFSSLDQYTDGEKVDGVVLDIGVSSMQLDQAERGFSFQKSGPLDMRMAKSGVSAYDAITHLTHAELARVFKTFGDEPRAKRCADFIVRAREDKAIVTTDALADIIGAALGRGGKRHPATRVFQALRIYINDELGELYQALLAAERILKPGGRLVVVSFHSLEDRMVKTFFKQRCGKLAGTSRYAPPTLEQGPVASFICKGKQGLAASAAEIQVNPRARSARLRYGVRTDAASMGGDYAGFAGIPSLSELSRRAA